MWDGVAFWAICENHHYWHGPFATLKRARNGAKRLPVPPNRIVVYGRLTYGRDYRVTVQLAFEGFGVGYVTPIYEDE